MPDFPGRKKEASVGFAVKDADMYLLVMVLNHANRICKQQP